MIIALTRNFVG